MALDPSIPLQAGQGTAAPQNPLAMAGQAVGIANAIGQNKLLGVQTQAADQGLNAVRQKAIAGIALNGLVHNDDRKMYDAIVDGLERAEAAGVVPKDQKERYLQSMLAARDSGHLRDMVMREGFKALDPNGMVAQIYGTPSSVNIGDAVVSGVTGPARTGGAFSPAAALPTTLSPTDRTTEIPTVGPDNQPGTIPRGTRFDRFGNPIAGGGTLPGAYPAQGGAGGAPPAFNPTGRSPANVADQEAYQGDLKTVPERTQRLAGLSEAHKALEIINSGRSTATLQKAREFLVARGVTPDWVDTETNAYAKAKKYLIDYAARSGGRSDQALQAAIESNASTDIPNQAALDIVRNNIGQERLDLARVQSHNDRTGSGYLKHAEKFSADFDRRAFAADLYPPAERQKLFDSLKGAEREKFIRSLKEAERLGIVKF